MPPWAALVPRSIRILRKSAIGTGVSLQRCRNAKFARIENLRVRSASTHVSPTAIGSRPTVPPQNQELYSALEELGAKADRYVNASRLQLALRGLSTENERVVTRVAVLGMDGRRTAEEVARLLLADPLGAEGQWEKSLGGKNGGELDERAVLLRFGDEDDAHVPNPLFRTLSVPSRVLKVHNMEVLVSTLNVGLGDAPKIETLEGPNEAILVPKLRSPSARGAPTPYSVHKTIVVGRGLESAMSYGRYTSASISGSKDTTSDMIKVIIDLPAPAHEPDTKNKEASSCTQISITSGTEALAKFRQSIANSEAYEQGWYKSGLPHVSEWLIDGTQPSPEAPTATKPVVRRLISSIIDDVEEALIAEDIAQLHTKLSTPTQSEITASILAHVAKWAETSHAELRDGLDVAFSSRSWQKLAWWKLFWRVDDVTMICEELLSRHYLVEAEKGCIFLAGRMEQAGYPDTISMDPVPAVPLEQEPDDLASTAVEEPLSPSDSTLTPTSTPISDQPNLALSPSSPLLPWPTHIPLSRTTLLTTHIPPLQSLAQRLVLQSLSTTSLATALSALSYVSIPSFSLFEAGTIAALGVVYSLRRMQRVWGEGRKVWEEGVREEGRGALRSTEDGVKSVIRGGAEHGGEGEARREKEERRRKMVREVVGRVRGMLESIGKG